MKHLKRLILLVSLAFFMFGMNSCITINTTKSHPVFKTHPKNNGKKKGHSKHKHHKGKSKGKHKKHKH